MLRGNLAHGLKKLFEPFGTVQSAQVILDRDTGRKAREVTGKVSGAQGSPRSVELGGS